MTLSDDMTTSSPGGTGEGPADGGADRQGVDGGADGSAGEGPADGGANPEGSDGGADGGAGGEGPADGGANRRASTAEPTAAHADRVARSGYAGRPSRRPPGAAGACTSTLPFSPVITGDG